MSYSFSEEKFSTLNDSIRYTTCIDWSLKERETILRAVILNTISELTKDCELELDQVVARHLRSEIKHYELEHKLTLAIKLQGFVDDYFKIIQE